jgi:endonuclease YncB( thermonuclease family)
VTRSKFTGRAFAFWGIDAPESSQLCRGEDSLQYRCGAKAANELDAFIARRPVDCSPVSLDQYRRTVAVCSIDGVDLAGWLVRNGLALDWPTYSKGKYDKAQRDAEHAGRRMWAGSYVEPWLFRACIRQGGKPGDSSDDAQSHP